MIKAIVASAFLLTISLAVGIFLFASNLTGAPNPNLHSWPAQAQKHLSVCQQDFKSGSHGIGACVNSFTK